ncbi:MAG: hypothetical protein GY710_14055 [Desulfobacteraceae bacterium]|nr:hypothetical protein [Desulfobacteraceae bacterium]
MNQVEGWTVSEIAETCNMKINRVSEIKNFSKYQRPINETFLAAFIGGGVVTIDELKEKAALSDDEKKFMDDMSFYEDKTLRKELQAATKEGIDVLSLIRKARQDKKNS